MGEYTGLNLIITCIGLIICFGGIFWRRFISGLTGLLWGALIGIIILIIQSESRSHNLQDFAAFIVVLSCAVLLCVLAVRLERLFAAINSFISSFFILCILSVLLIKDYDSIPAALIIAGLLAFLIACISYVYHNYAYIIATAFSGALIASLGITGLMNHTDALSVLLDSVMSGSHQSTTHIMIITVILGCLGCYVQILRFRSTPAAPAEKADTPSSSFTHAEHSTPTIDTEKVADAAAKVAESTKQAAQKAGESAKQAAQKAGDAAAPVLRDAKKSVQSVLDELKSEQGRQDLWQQIKQSKYLFIPVFVYAWLVPLVYLLLRNSSSYHSALYTILYYLRLISSAMSLGILVFFSLVKDAKLTLVYASVFTVGKFVFDHSQLSYQRMGLLFFLEFFLIWAVLAIVMKLIKKDAVKPLLASLLAYFLSYFLLDWIVYRYIGFEINLWTFILLAIVIGEEYLLFDKLCHLNIFKFGATSAVKPAVIHPSEANTHVGNSASSKYCAKCNQFYDSDSAFCALCGEKLQTVCPSCHNAVTKDATFCAHCGQKL